MRNFIGVALSLIAVGLSLWTAYLNNWTRDDILIRYQPKDLRAAIYDQDDRDLGEHFVGDGHVTITGSPWEFSVTNLGTTNFILNDIVAVFVDPQYEDDPEQCKSIPNSLESRFREVIGNGAVIVSNEFHLGVDPIVFEKGSSQLIQSTFSRSVNAWSLKSTYDFQIDGEFRQSEHEFFVCLFAMVTFSDGEQSILTMPVGRAQSKAVDRPTGADSLYVDVESTSDVARITSRFWSRERTIEISNSSYEVLRASESSARQ
ncbi:MAG: hypothetical protein AAFR65_03830 [Pseudomonadota bacterium]